MKLGLALSGGGFRATLYHIGVIRYLHDAKLLEKVTHITSVSGGSIIAAHLVLNWKKYIGNNVEFAEAVEEVLKFINYDIRPRIVRRIPVHFFFKAFGLFKSAFGEKKIPSITDYLEYYYKNKLYGSTTLRDLRQNDIPILYMLTTNLRDGSLCSINYEGIKNEKTNELILGESIDIATAVAASSAFPALFPPIEITTSFHDRAGIGKMILTDGGVYDNLGIRKMKNLTEKDGISFDKIIVSDASMKFSEKVGFSFLNPTKIPPLRSIDIYSQRIHDLEIIHAEPELFIKVLINSIVKPENDEDCINTDIQFLLPYIRTDLDKFSDIEVTALIKHGYCVAKKAILECNLNVESELNMVNTWVPKLRFKDKKFGPKEKSKLSKSIKRKIHLLSYKDRISYVYLMIPMFMIFIYLYIYLPVHDKNISNEILSYSDTLINEYSKELRNRINLKYQVILPQNLSIPEIDSSVAETWASSQALYSLLNISDSIPLGEGEVFSLINSRFDPSICEDIDPNGIGWYTRPGLKQQQIEPALWTALSLTKYYQIRESNSQRDSIIEKNIYKIQRILDSNFRQTKILDNNQSSRYENQPHNGWYTLPKVLNNKGDYSVYSTSIALLFCMEAFKKKIGWIDKYNYMDKCETYITETTTFLREKYIKGQGWCENDELNQDPEPVNNNTSDGLTLQIYSILLLAEEDSLCTIDKSMIDDIQNKLLTLEKKDFSNYYGRMVTTGAQSSQVIINYLWRPWAILCCQLLIQRANRNNNVFVSVFRLRDILYKLIVESGKNEFLSYKGGPTFILSEMLFVLTKVKESITKDY